MTAKRLPLQPHDPEAVEVAAERVARKRAMHVRFLAAAASDGKRQWFVVGVRPRSEKAVENELADQGVTAWVPLKNERSSRMRRRRIDGRQGPAVPGYVFVRMVADAAGFLGVLGLRDVVAFLGTGERPAPVRNEIMDALKDLVEGGAFDEGPCDRLRRVLTKGDRVQIQGGAFAFVEAVVIGYRGGRSARVMANLFGGDVPMQVPLTNLQRIA